MAATASHVIHTVEMHTGGEPVRIVVAGWPEVKGQTIVEKRRYVLEHHDHLRRQLMLEPRGSEGMYGVLLVEPDLPGAAMAALFMHGEGFSTMCGHATISIGRYAIDYGIVKPTYPETHFTLQCPCGPLKVTVQTREGKDGKPVTGAVSYESVPTYVAAPNQKVEVEGRGSVSYDLCFAGTFYAMVNADEVGVDLTDTKTCVSFAGDITDKLRSTLQISHPENPDLAFVYGTILYRNVEEDGEPCSHQQCVFADRQWDRSTCGSGSQANAALQYSKGTLKIGQCKKFINIKTGCVFTATVLREERSGQHDAVVLRVAGNGYYLGEAKYWQEEDDKIGRGILT